jgi:hypothetical protein
MRPHLTPTIRDKWLLGASKTVDDDLIAFGKIVEIVRPLLHHATSLEEVLGVIVGGADLVALVVRGRCTMQILSSQADLG